MKKLLTISTALVLSSCVSTDSYERFDNEDTGLAGIKKNGRVWLAAKYRHVFNEHPPFSKESESSELLSVMKFNGEWVRLNKKGEEAFLPVWHDNGPDYYNQDLSRFVNRSKRVGFHDRNGNIVVEAKYTYAYPFADSIMQVQEPFESKYALVCNGCYIKPFKNEKWYPASNSGTHGGIISTNEPPYRSVVGGKWGVVDTMGNEVIPVKYNSDIEATKTLTIWKKRQRYR